MFMMIFVVYSGFIVYLSLFLMVIVLCLKSYFEKMMERIFDIFFFFLFMDFSKFFVFFYGFFIFFVYSFRFLMCGGESVGLVRLFFLMMDGIMLSVFSFYCLMCFWFSSIMWD